MGFLKLFLQVFGGWAFFVPTLPQLPDYISADLEEVCPEYSAGGGVLVFAPRGLVCHWVSITNSKVGVIAFNY